MNIFSKNKCKFATSSKQEKISLNNFENSIGDSTFKSYLLKFLK